MKKLLIFVAAGMLLASSAFAGHNYHGDVQVHGGIGFSETETEQKNGDIKSKLFIDSVEFNLDVETWQLFDLNSMLSVGFMAGIDFGVGGTTAFKQQNTVNNITTTSSANSDNLAEAAHIGFIIGPAVGFKLGDVVRFDGTFGFSAMFVQSYALKSKIGDKDNHMSYNTSACGVGLEVQAKFFPEKVFSPIAGYRYTATFANKLTTIYEYDGNKTEKTNTIESIIVGNGVFYLGCSFNW